MTDAATKAKRHWLLSSDREEHAREFPADCGHCHRAFRTERGAIRHRRYCPANPAATMYASGEYDPIVRGEKIVGYIWNGRSEQERQRIRKEMLGIGEALGLPTPEFGPSQRTRTLGPDVTEPCAACPEPRGEHADLTGPCGWDGCGCRSFVGAVNIGDAGGHEPLAHRLVVVPHIPIGVLVPWPLPGRDTTRPAP